jgi:uncharacterized protein with HEPN domain
MSAGEAKLSQDAYLQDILTSTRQALGYVAGMSFDEFWSDGKTRDAVSMRLVVIGEAARNITPETQALLPNIPFPKISGMRHRIAHEYQKVNFRIVWDVVSKELPKLAADLEPYLLKEKQRLEQEQNQQQSEKLGGGPKPAP